MTSVPVAVAIPYPALQNDRLFQVAADGAVDQAHYAQWAHLRRMGREQGFELFTADLVPERGIDPRDCLLISYDWMELSQTVVAAGARPALALTLEPPVIAWQFYVNLRSISARFPHTFAFEGARPRVHPRSTFHPLSFPQVRRHLQQSGRPWNERRFLVVIASNKGIVRPWVPNRWLDRPREVSVKRTLAALRYPPIRAELYRERLRGITYFAARKKLDLFGVGWAQRHPSVSKAAHQTALSAYRGTLDRKLRTLSQYRFSLCLENSRFPGYVSEKLFDCFFSGCIPIYLGAPDVDQYVPKDAFIDLRHFRDYDELDAYLSCVSLADAERYLDAARTYLGSASFAQFSEEAFARQVIAALTATACQDHSATAGS